MSTALMNYIVITVEITAFASSSGLTTWDHKQKFQTHQYLAQFFILDLVFIQRSQLLAQWYPILPHLKSKASIHRTSGVHILISTNPQPTPPCKVSLPHQPAPCQNAQWSGDTASLSDAILALWGAQHHAAGSDHSSPVVQHAVST